MSKMDERRKYQMSYAKGKTTYDDLKTMPEFLEYYAQNAPSREAFVFVYTDGTREAVTFKDLYEESRLVAKRFIEIGVKKSELVAVCLRTGPQWLYVVFGAIMAGARPISLAFTYSDGSDIIAIMQKLQTCSTIVLDPGPDDENWNIFKNLIISCDSNGNVKSDKMPYLRYLICHDRPRINQDVLLLSEMASWKLTDTVLPDLDPDDIAILFQTSGSTGNPKAVAHTHKSILAAYVISYTEPKPEIMYNDRPFGWVGGFPGAMFCGHTRVTRSDYCDPPEDVMGFTIDAVKREQCTILSLLPPLVNELTLRQNEVGDDWPLQIIASAGQPITKQVTNCIGKLCRAFVFYYGSTETLPISTIIVFKPGDVEDRSVGQPNPRTEIKIVDENEQVVPVNTCGEIYVKSKCLLKEYYNDLERTRASLTADGWFRTDDVGFMNEDGTFFCEGRKSEIIISGGINVAPSVLEATLEKCPGVAHAICVPVPHNILFQAVCACVILDKGSDVTEEKLRNYLESVHNDKPRLFTVLPTYYMFMDRFPELQTGKISRKELAEKACDYLKTNCKM